MEDFECIFCDRKQSYAPEYGEYGITESEAGAFGWYKSDKGWICPFCSGAWDDDEPEEMDEDNAPPL